MLSIVGIVSLVYGLIEAPDKGWSSAATLGAFAVGVVALALFVVWELHVDEPMLDIRYFRNPAFSTGTGGMILVFLAMYGVDVPHHPVLPAGARLHAARPALRLLPMAPIMIIVAPADARGSAPGSAPTAPWPAAWCCSPSAS